MNNMSCLKDSWHIPDQVKAVINKKNTAKAVQAVIQKQTVPSYHLATLLSLPHSVYSLLYRDHPHNFIIIIIMSAVITLEHTKHFREQIIFAKVDAP